jgi:hypothetical protein
MRGLHLLSSVARRCDGRETGEVPASNGSVWGWRRQLGGSPSSGAGSYHNRTTVESFSWDVLGEVMLPVHLRLQASQECRHKLVDAVRGNPDDGPLHAQLAQAVHDLEAATAPMRGLEVEWGFIAPPPPAAP